MASINLFMCAADGIDGNRGLGKFSNTTDSTVVCSPAQEKSSADEKPYSCKHCGKSFRCLSSYNSHMSIHAGDKAYICKTCRKTFTSSADLTLHRKSNRCNVYGTRPGYIITHTRVHSDVKPYRCDNCGGGFGRKWDLKRHIVAKHSASLNSNQTVTMPTCQEPISDVSSSEPWQLGTGHLLFQTTSHWRQAGQMSALWQVFKCQVHWPASENAWREAACM